MRPFTIAGIQMFVSSHHGNIDRMEHSLDKLLTVYPWVQLVLFSELAAFGALPRNAETIPGPATDRFCGMAAKHQVWLIPGSIFEKDETAIYNTSVVINPDGKIVGRYRKMYPFAPYEEGVSGGDKAFIFDIPKIGRFGISICYDIWFPETSRTLAVNGAEVILHPSMTPTIDRDAELAIVRATAAINQCFVFDINGVGDGGNERSIICGPDGRVLYEGGNAEELIPLEIDLERVARSRENGLLRLGQPLKSFRDRKITYDIYQENASIPYLESLGALRKHGRPQA